MLGERTLLLSQVPKRASALLEVQPALAKKTIRVYQDIATTTQADTALVQLL